MRWMVGLIVVGLAGAVCSSEGKDAGTEGGPCFANGTCNTGLSCLSETCVDPTGGSDDTGGGPQGDAIGGDTATSGTCDATNPCPQRQFCDTDLTCAPCVDICSPSNGDTLQCQDPQVRFCKADAQGCYAWSDWGHCAHYCGRSSGTDCQ